MAFPQHKNHIYKLFLTELHDDRSITKLKQTMAQMCSYVDNKACVLKAHTPSSKASLDIYCAIQVRK